MSCLHSLRYLFNTRRPYPQHGCPCPRCDQQAAPCVPVRRRRGCLNGSMARLACGPTDQRRGRMGASMVETLISASHAASEHPSGHCKHGARCVGAARQVVLDMHNAVPSHCQHPTASRSNTSTRSGKAPFRVSWRLPPGTGQSRGVQAGVLTKKVSSSEVEEL